MGKDDQTLAGFARNLALGGTSAAISKTVNSPLEVMKLMLQTDSSGKRRVVATAREFLRDQGVRGFWRGNGTNILRYFPTQALNFAFKDTYSELLLPADATPTYGQQVFASVVAGGLAGGTSMLVVYPLDMARTRLSTDVKRLGKNRYRGLSHCLSVTYRQQGVRGLYRGLLVSLAGITPYRAIYFGGYTGLKTAVTGGDETAVTSFWTKWAIGQTTTVFAQMLTYPVDTVRRMLMKSGEELADGSHRRAYSSAWECFQHLRRTVGWRGIYSGALINTFRATGAALCIAMYDTAQEYIAESA